MKQLIIIILVALLSAMSSCSDAQRGVYTIQLTNGVKVITQPSHLALPKYKHNDKVFVINPHLSNNWYITNHFESNDTNILRTVCEGRVIIEE